MVVKKMTSHNGRSTFKKKLCTATEKMFFFYFEFFSVSQPLFLQSIVAFLSRMEGGVKDMTAILQS